MPLELVTLTHKAAVTHSLISIQVTQTSPVLLRVQLTQFSIETRLAREFLNIRSSKKCLLHEFYLCYNDVCKCRLIILVPVGISSTLVGLFILSTTTLCYKYILFPIPCKIFSLSQHNFLITTASELWE